MACIDKRSVEAALRFRAMIRLRGCPPYTLRDASPRSRNRLFSRGIFRSGDDPDVSGLTTTRMSKNTLIVRRYGCHSIHAGDLD
ncbi:MAG: hypothetical protein LBF60_00345 [Treponema sp.]|nr:hypothetical protein [Treponema sp.]